jgi:hypothetical protein
MLIIYIKTGRFGNFIRAEGLMPGNPPFGGVVDFQMCRTTCQALFRKIFYRLGVFRSITNDNIYVTNVRNYKKAIFSRG